jgi:hypothetical protein
MGVIRFVAFGKERFSATEQGLAVYQMLGRALNQLSLESVLRLGAP